MNNIQTTLTDKKELSRQTFLVLHLSRLASSFRYPPPVNKLVSGRPAPAAPIPIDVFMTELVPRAVCLGDSVLSDLTFFVSSPVIQLLRPRPS